MDHLGFSVGAGAAGPGAVVCADAEATVPFIDLARGLATMSRYVAG